MPPVFVAGLVIADLVAPLDPSPARNHAGIIMIVKTSPKKI